MVYFRLIETSNGGLTDTLRAAKAVNRVPSVVKNRPRGSSFSVGGGDEM